MDRARGDPPALHRRPGPGAGRWPAKGGRRAGALGGCRRCRRLQPGLRRHPASTTDFIDFVVPELRKRGRVQTAYAQGTLREKLLGDKDGKTRESHPATHWRRHYVGKESVADASGPAASWA